MGDPLQLAVLTGRQEGECVLDVGRADAGLARPVPAPEISSPGLALAGYVKRFPANRLQVFGETEITYLNSLPAEQRRKSLEKFFEFELPCIFVTKGQEVPPEMLELARSRGVHDGRPIGCCRLRALLEGAGVQASLAQASAELPAVQVTRASPGRVAGPPAPPPTAAEPLFFPRKNGLPRRLSEGEILIALGH